MKHAALLILILSLFAIPLSAQELTGRLTDEKSAPLSFANVALLRAADSSLAAAVLTDSSGAFRMPSPPAGTYLLRFTSIGFSELRTAPFTVNGDPFARDFGTLKLASQNKGLQDVTVAALRPTITQGADRLTVGVEGTAMAAGANAFTVLSKAPGVFIDPEGNIQLNGRSGVTVMIDGRPTYLSARDLRTMLEGMPAENLKNIEIITNPSARFDAEGTSGILNLNLRKNNRQGVSGSLSSGYNYNGKQHGATGNAAVYWKKGAFNSFFNADFARRVGGREATFTRVFYNGADATYFDQVATGNFLNEGPPAVRLGTDYTIDPKHSVGFMSAFTRNRSFQDFLTDTWIGNAPKSPGRYVEANNYSYNTYQNFTTNLHYVGKLDSLGKQLSSDVDYVRIASEGTSDFQNYYTDLSAPGNRRADLLQSFTPAALNIYSAKADLVLPLKGKGGKLETGVRASRVETDNDFRFFFNNAGRVNDPRRSNHFRYNESIYAAYLSWNKTLSPKLTMQAGLRAEQTRSLANSVTLGKSTPRRYTNLFPSLFLQHKVSENYGMNWSFSRRLTRPNYGSLNEFRAYRDPYTWYVGNPLLRPSYTNSLSLAQTFKKQYTVTVNYQRSSDVMIEIPILLVEDTATVYTTGNIDNSRSLGLTGIAPLRIRKGWDTQNTLVLSHQRFDASSNLGALRNQQLFYSVQSNHTILLPQALRLELNLLYRGPAAAGLYHQAAMNRVDVALKRTFFNKKFDLTINATDLFKGFRYYWTTDIGGNVNEFDQYFRWRTIGFNLRYNFSSGAKVEERKRANTVEELNRT